MSEASNNPQSGMFAEPPVERGFPTTAVAIASVAVVILVAILVLMNRHHAPVRAGNTIQPVAAYASNLVISNIQMSEADSQLGGKSTYIDGHIANHGTATVTAITTQEIFSNDLSLPPQVESTELLRISSREPYIDTEPLSAAPLAPGAEADFRLIFENINSNWNTQPPAIHLIVISTR
jgi:hypothetical protein